MYMYVCKTERFQAVQESAQYRVVELVQTIVGTALGMFELSHIIRIIRIPPVHVLSV